MTARNGGAEWRGDVRSGSGMVVVGNGVFEGPYSYASRFGEEEGTNPEQLIAAAHAACFTMALSSILSGAGHVRESLSTNAREQLRIVNTVAVRYVVEGTHQGTFLPSHRPVAACAGTR